MNVFGNTMSRCMNANIATIAMKINARASMEKSMLIARTVSNDLVC